MLGKLIGKTLTRSNLLKGRKSVVTMGYFYIPLDEKGKPDLNTIIRVNKSGKTVATYKKV